MQSKQVYTQSFPQPSANAVLVDVYTNMIILRETKNHSTGHILYFLKLL